ncbi:uncharacterized protein LOC111276475 [Durio zibethinus]|uniref:Uncharacterized protein LOC111276475 n=1 Tax=Durio zibethinus TaxID=66656 RepID=A0A6P5WPA1_DURZI|nr:uncharacterized protein LOC111276475 [Durio zibethinus]
MRSFLEFVSCCVTTPEVSVKEQVVTAGTAPRKEETRSLMPTKVAALRKKKKRVRVGTPGSLTPEWKPSLFVISEDKVTAEKREKTPPQAATATVDRVVKRKSTTGSRSKVHVRSYSDDIGRNSVQVVIPAFSPTPFMF